MGGAVSARRCAAVPMTDDESIPSTHDLLTVSAAAQQIGVTRFTVNSWIRRGWLPTLRVQGRRSVRPEDLETTQAQIHLGEVIPAWRQDRERVGRRLRLLREAAGRSQLQLAEASGL